MVEGFNLGNAYGSVTIDASGVDAAINAARSTMESFFTSVGGVFQSIGQSLTSAGAQISMVSIPIAAAGKVGLDAAADYETLMNQIKVFGGVGENELTKISQLALQMGADTQFSASDAAAAYLELLKSGQSVESAMAMLPQVMGLATVGSISLADASGILTSSFAQFGLTMGVEVPANFDALMSKLGVTDQMFTDFGNGADTVSGNMVDLAGALGLNEDEMDKLYAMWNASKGMTPEMQDMATQLGITKEQWQAYGKSVTNITPEIKKMIDATGLSGQRLAELFAPIDNAQMVTNALAKAANASRADVADLGVALQNVGPVAAQMGLNVEDTAAILAVFSNNGIQGAEAGTQLKSLLLSLTRPTDEVKGAFNQLGVSLYDSNGNVRDFNTVLVELDTALDALPVEQQNELMQTLAGSYGIVGLNALRASGGIDEMRDAMEKAPDAAAVAAELMKGFAGNVESLKGSIETLMIQALTPFMQNVLQPLVTRLIEVANALTLWVQANPELTQQIVSVLAVVAALGPGLVILGKGFELAGGAISTMGKALGLLTSPIGIAIGLAAGLAYAYINNLGGLRDFVDNEVRPIVEQFIGTLSGIWERVQPALEALGNWFVNDSLPAVATFIQNVVIPAMQWLIQAISDIWTVAQPYLEAIGDWFINDALPSVVSFINGTVIPAIQRFAEIIGYIWTDAQPYLAALGDWFVSSGLPAVIGFIRDVATWAIQGFINLLSGAWGIIQPLIQPLADWFSAPGGLGIMLTYASSTATTILNTFFGLLQDAWGVIEPLIRPLETWFSENGGLGGALQYASSTATTILTNFFGLLEGAWAIIQPLLQPLVEWFINSGLPGAVAFVRDTATAGIQGFINVLSGAWEIIQPLLQPLADWFSDVGGLGGVLTYASGTATTILNAFFGLIQGAWTLIEPLITPLATWFSEQGGLGGVLAYIGNTFATGFNTFTTLISSVWTTVSAGITTFKTELDKAFLWVETNVITPIVTAVQTVIDTINSIWTSISAAVNTFKTELDKVFSWIVTNVINPVKVAIDAVVDAFNAAQALLTGKTPNYNYTPTNSNNPLSGIPGFGGAKASGGSVRANSTYLVGEMGPEIFVPRSGGTIIPNNAIGGLGGMTNTTQYNYTITVTPQINPVAGNVYDQADQFANQLLLRLQTS